MNRKYRVLAINPGSTSTKVGGIARDSYLVNGITEMVRYIAPVKVYAGEFELEALASGALRVLSGQEEAKTYTGVPVWSGFERK